MKVAGHCQRSLELRDGVQRDVLIANFGVPSFPLDQVREEDKLVAAYRWLRPEGAKVVRCGLFVCEPTFRIDVLPDNYSITRITNFDRCVLAQASFEPGDGTFDLRRGEIRNADASAACNDGQPSSWLISSFLVGCWAYDASHVIAATALVPVDPAAIYDFGVLDRTCSDPASPNCLLGDGALGTCYSGRCLPRCSTPADCLGRRPAGDAGRCEGPSVAQCVPTSSQTGVCVSSVSSRPDASIDADGGESDAPDDGSGGADAAND